MSSPNPETSRLLRRSSMCSKRKLVQGSQSPAPKRIKKVHQPTDSGLLPSKEAPLRLTHSKSRSISFPPLASPSKAGAGACSGAGFSSASPCRCTAKDRQEVLIEACERLIILCDQEDLDWSLLFAMQALYRPLERRIKT